MDVYELGVRLLSYIKENLEVSIYHFPKHIHQVRATFSGIMDPSFEKLYYNIITSSNRIINAVLAIIYNHLVVAGNGLVVGSGTIRCNDWFHKVYENLYSP